MRYAKLDQKAKDPVRKHPTDAGIDVFAVKTVVIAPYQFAIVKTGIMFEIPDGYCLQVWPKSRHHHLVGAGIVDTGYQGEILVKVVNYSDRDMWVYEGDAVAQLVLVKIDTPELQQASAEELQREKTPRGASGGIVAQQQ